MLNKIQEPLLNTVNLVIRRCQRSLVAIPGYGIPLLRCLLPLAARYKSCLDALMTLATRLHASGSQITDIHPFAEDSLSDGNHNHNTILNRYQDTVSTLRSSLAQLQPGDNNTEEAIAMSMILWIFGFPSHDIWGVHLNGLIALLELNRVPSFVPFSLISTASDVAAHADIKAFSLGRLESSRRLWLHWNIHPPGKDPTAENQPFSSFEISAGYPQSLVTIIALLSAVVDSKLAGEALDAVSQTYITELASGLHDSKLKDAGKLTVSILLGPQFDEHEDSLAAKMELIIRTWEPPSTPAEMPVDTKLALMTSWDIMQKAALIFLWRGGFERDVLSVLTLHRQSLIDRFIPEMCLGIDQVIQMAEKYDITVANALIWPITVVANECSRYPQFQPTILEYIRRLYSYFMIPHHQILGLIIQRLWERASQGAYFGILSLQHICLKENVRLPLL